MPLLKILDAAGQSHEVSADSGMTVMEAAVDNNLAGMLAECGGACACATCHVYVADEWAQRLPAMDDMEDAMLDSALDRHANSRLACQLELSDELDGLELTIADNEG